MTPPQGLVHSRGGAGSPDVQIKGPKPPAQSAAVGYRGLSPKHSPLKWRKGGGWAHLIPGKGKLCLSPDVGTGTVLEGEHVGERGWSRDHKSIRDQRSRSQQAPVNQTGKSKSPGRGRKGSLGSLAGGRAASMCHRPSPGPRHQFMMQLRFRVMK